MPQVITQLQSIPDLYSGDNCITFTDMTATNILPGVAWPSTPFPSDVNGEAFFTATTDDLADTVRNGITYNNREMVISWGYRGNPGGPDNGYLFCDSFETNFNRNVERYWRYDHPTLPQSRPIGVLWDRVTAKSFLSFSAYETVNYADGFADDAHILFRVVDGTAPTGSTPNQSELNVQLFTRKNNGYSLQLLPSVTGDGDGFPLMVWGGTALLGTDRIVELRYGDSGGNGYTRVTYRSAAGTKLYNRNFANSANAPLFLQASRYQLDVENSSQYFIWANQQFGAPFYICDSSYYITAQTGFEFHAGDAYRVIINGIQKLRVDSTKIVLNGHICTDQTSAASSVSGHSIVAKAPFYDANGTIVGYVPIYDAIT